MTGHSSFQNGKLLAEQDGVKRRTEELAMEKDALKVPPLPRALTTSQHPCGHFYLTSFSHRALVRARQFGRNLSV